MKENKRYKCYFDKEWCPLFGELPPFKNGAPSSLVYVCIDIIAGARELLGVPPFKFLKKEYPKTDLQTARTIFSCYDSISQHAMEKAYRRSDGVIEEYHDTFTNWEFAVDFVRDFHCGMFFDDEWEDYGILTVFAVAEAWNTLKNLLYYEESEGDEINIKSVLTAQRLLTLAMNKAKQPDYELGVKRRKDVQRFGIKSGQNRQAEVKTRNAGWVKAYKENIRSDKKNEKLSLPSAAGYLYKKMPPDEEGHKPSFSTFYKVLLNHNKSENAVKTGRKPRKTLKS